MDVKSFYSKPSSKNYIFELIAFGILGLVYVFCVPHSPYLNILELFILVVILAGAALAVSSTPHLVIKKNSLIVRLSPSASRIFLSKEDLKGVTVSDKKITLDSTVRGPLSIPLSLFGADDRSAIVGKFESFTKVNGIRFMMRCNTGMHLTF